MHNPSHLARPNTGHHPDGSYYLPPGLDIESLANPGTYTPPGLSIDRLMGIALAPAPPIPVMDRKDQIFVDLLRLRRYATRLKWWQFSERRRIDNEIIALKAEQDALHTLDSIVSQYKAEQASL